MCDSTFSVGFGIFAWSRRGGIRPHSIALNQLQSVFAVIWPLAPRALGPETQVAYTKDRWLFTRALSEAP